MARTKSSPLHEVSDIKWSTLTRVEIAEMYGLTHEQVKNFAYGNGVPEYIFKRSILEMYSTRDLQRVDNKFLMDALGLSYHTARAYRSDILRSRGIFLSEGAQK